MKKIKLINLKLTNFKGIKEFDLVADGNDLNIFGGNETGKTTLFDAFIWLLFDKNSNNAKTGNFNVKTLVDGKPVSKIEHSVEAELDVDGSKATLKKVYKEKWTKKRGSNTEDFTGHTTDYYVNEVPNKKGEYEQAIAELVDENVFKLLTSPTYFNESFHWKERRDLLLSIAGGITDEEVVASDEKLAKLLDVLNGNSIEDHKKIINAKRRDINEKIKVIPIRIDEIYRGLPDLSKLNKEEIESGISIKSGEIESLNEEINNIKNGSHVMDIDKKMNDIEMKINSVKSNHEQDQKQELYKLQTKKSEEEANSSILRNDIRSKMEQKRSSEQLIESKKEQMNELREAYSILQDRTQEANAKEFDTENCTCPTCEQDLPQENIDESVARFNKRKSDELEMYANKQKEINEKGIKLKQEVEQLTQDIEPIEKEIEVITEQGKKKESDIKFLTEKIEKAESTVVPVEENEEFIALNKDKKDLEKQIEELEVSIEQSLSEVREKIAKLEKERNELQEDLSKFSQVDLQNKRIAELEQEEKTLATEYQELEHQLYLTEEFTRKKVNMLTENINEKFKYAKFNLFKENINGGLEETCETTYKGVPYGTDLNNAAKINVGLDIINTLSNHYGVQAPIFVDNAESVTDLIDVDSQLISLVVSKEDKELRVESNSEEIEVA